ncbi:helix-hairpin-helix domain-containing protein [Micromonospora endolithica]|uniref:Helix-hairpin-helix domain-containing protein n=1 Tax=Micromonospora endolithica TaxID=230091 RepID=A0A3A9YY47_9ACTN|nr:helix-hairpin-helix domain-containing protein [Micromonospora endolithica]RKN40584.1 hypothetical protein D7223_25945 [Micromonospora endolithica]TWJ21665.1 putative flap endonuclease-1-like 5' DNA nuclease [Micromonospora endolithica]
MAWSFGHWLILIVALAVGAGAGWVLRARRDAAATGAVRPIVEGDPAGSAAVVTPPAPAATIDEDRPTATVDPAPSTAVADQPAPGDHRVATPSGTADDVDPADMVLTGDPVPPPPSGDTLPVAQATDRDGDLVLPVAAEVTGPVGTTTGDPADPPVVAPRPVPAAERIEPADPTPADPSPADDAPATVTAGAAAPSTTEPVPTAPLAPAGGVTDGTDGPAAAPTTGTTDDRDAAPAPVTAPTTDTTDAAEPSSGPTTDAAGDRDAAPAPAIADDAAPVPSAATAAAPERSVEDADDFRRIQGVGPKIATALQAAGIRTYRQLADLDEAALRETVRAAGLRSAPGLATWPQQAKVLAGAPETTAVLPGGAEA